MEFSWGYAAARAPFPTTYQQRPQAGPPPSASSVTPGTSGLRRQPKDGRSEGQLQKKPQEKDEDEDKHEPVLEPEPDEPEHNNHNQAPKPSIRQRLDPHFYPPFQRSSRTPARSNSVSEATSSKRRPRILGHSRASSSSSRSRSSNETGLQHYQLEPRDLPKAAAGTNTQSGGSGLSRDTALNSDTGAHEYHHLQRQPPQPQQQPSRSQISAPVKSRRNKRLPATPSADTSTDINSHDTCRNTGARTGDTGPEVAAARTPSSPRFSHRPVVHTRSPDLSSTGVGIRTASAPTQSPIHNLHCADHTRDSLLDRRLTHERRQQHAAMFPDQVLYSGRAVLSAGVSAPFTVPTTSPATPGPRTESINSASGATTHSGRTMLSTEPPTGAETAPIQPRPFVVRNGRSYIADPTLYYPLPVDLAELHRQSLRTLLLFQLFGGPVCSPVFANTPPTRVLEVGCGNAFWSMMCHRYYARHGHTNISFTGIDIAPVAPNAGGHVATTTTTGGGGGGSGNRASASSSASGPDGRPDKDMRWRFVQHDLRRLPWPFADGEFDLVMVKDMSLATPLAMQQAFVDEYVRVLRPGGVIEIWESDYTLRMLRPHVPEGGGTSQAAKRPHGSAEDESTDDPESEQDEHEAAANHGAYLLTSNTPLSAPLNNFLVEYNGWVSKALEARSLSAVPCTLIGALLRQEVDTLTGVESKRLAVPLSEVRWEREGVGGVVTKDGKSYIETKGRRGGVRSEAGGGRPLGASQTAVRRTALLTVVLQIQSLEAVLREVSGKSQDEWDGWCGKMMNDLMKENGTSWGESLEIGAWWARKKP